ncbi:MAG: ABC transporter ATP-binding protein [Ktedonobacteraceae bacterium]|nr:ABC transporter ATP-binding protein [Ktedonobacteraceae bacterium]
MVKQEGARAPLLEVRDLTFGYGREPVLYEVCMQVQAGEMLGLLGPNGSGKTTLLRLLSGVLSPRQGTVLLEGRDLRQWGRRGVARRIAVVSQELHMPFAFTVEQMVSLGRTPFINLLGSPSKHDRASVQEALRATDSAALGERIFNELSGGERQRVMIAMALAQEPGLLLLDEPTSHLDIKYQVETLALVQRLNRERGLTVIAAMHDLNLAARYFPRLVLFQRGIVADAGPAEVLEPALLSRVYGIEVHVGILRGAEHLSVLPPGSMQDERQPQPGARVHVMAGGGSGALLMRALADAHIPFVAGALNIGDSDHTLALRLASQVITEQPYAPLSPEILEQVHASLAQVSLLILCPAPIGPGNLALLREALTAARQGVAVVMLADTIPDEPAIPPVAGDDLLRYTGIATRDYTDGEGVKLVREMLQTGAKVVHTVGEAVEVARTGYAVL